MFLCNFFLLLLFLRWAYKRKEIWCEEISFQFLMNTRLYLFTSFSSVDVFYLFILFWEKMATNQRKKHRNDNKMNHFNVWAFVGNLNQQIVWKKWKPLLALIKRDFVWFIYDITLWLLCMTMWKQGLNTLITFFCSLCFCSLELITLFSLFCCFFLLWL